MNADSSLAEHPLFFSIPVAHHLFQGEGQQLEKINILQKEAD